MCLKSSALTADRNVINKFIIGQPSFVINIHYDNYIILGIGLTAAQSVRRSSPMIEYRQRVFSHPFTRHENCLHQVSFSKSTIHNFTKELETP